jgi:micrococcal nuclease
MRARVVSVVAVAVVALVSVACSGGSSGERGGTRDAAVVARVADGDTLELESGERVRLLQVDSPELGEGECYSEPARETLERLAPPGTELDLETDPGLDSVDDFGRLLRYVFANGENVNVALVRAGAAAPYFFEGNEGSYAFELLDAVKDAMNDGTGMWGACDVEWSQGRQVATSPR